jgi:hypothetical protein
MTLLISRVFLSNFINDRGSCNLFRATAIESLKILSIYPETQCTPSAS